MKLFFKYFKSSRLDSKCTEPIIGSVYDKWIHFIMSALGAVIIRLFIIADSFQAMLYIYFIGIIVEFIEQIRYIIDTESNFLKDRFDLSDTLINLYGAFIGAYLVEVVSWLIG